MEQETFSSVIISKEDPSLSHIYPRHTRTHTPPLTHADTLIHSKTHTHTPTHIHIQLRSPVLMLSDNISDLVFHVFWSAWGLYKQPGINYCTAFTLSQLLFLRLFHSECNIFTLKDWIREGVDECKTKIMSFIDMTDPLFLKIHDMPSYKKFNNIHTKYKCKYFFDLISHIYNATILSLI